MPGWPTPEEYNEAIQAPSLCFADAGLRSGRVECTPLGLPRPITGNFASVYRVETAAGVWAVRCFWRDFSDTAARYAAISRHLASVRCDALVAFDFLERGMLVNGRWFPILKMDWVAGEPLHHHIAQHLGDSARLRDLRRQWVELVGTLGRSSIAHGDLQHGNVLVHGHDLTLVDYDGMYVPLLEGYSSHELGHSNYQHPARHAGDFGPHLDRCAAWVIYLSLLACEVDPELWDRCGAGDERLLLHARDLKAPAQSPRMRLLSSHADPRIRKTAAILESGLPGPLRDFPVLHDVASTRRRWFLQARRHDVPASPPRPEALPAWLDGYVDRRQPSLPTLRRIPRPPLPRLRTRYRQHRTRKVHARAVARRAAVEAWIRTDVAALVSLLAANDRNRREAQRLTLERMRDVHVRRTLRRWRILTDGPPTIGPLQRLHLYLKGIRTAYDVAGKPTDAGVPHALRTWAAALRRGAIASAPRSLPPEVQSRLDRPYLAYGERVERAVVRAMREAQVLLDAVLEEGECVGADVVSMRKAAP